MPIIVDHKRQSQPKQGETKSGKYRKGPAEFDFLEDICRKIRKDSTEKCSFMVYHLLKMYQSGKLDENTRMLIWNHLMFDPAPDQAAMSKFREIVYDEIVEEFGCPLE